MLLRLLQVDIGRKSTTAVVSLIFLLEILLSSDSRQVTASQEPSRCSQESMAACQAPLSQLLDKQDFVIAVNKTQLLEACEKLKLALECVDDFLGTCYAVDRTQMDKFFSGFRLFLHNVCQEDSQFSTEYLRHAPCMSEAEDQIHSCMNDSRFGLVNPMSNNLASTITTDILDTVCCVMQHFLTCSEDVYGRHCGPDASRLGHQTLVTMLGPTIQTACMDNYGNFKCSSSIQRSPTSTTTSILSLTTFLVVYRIVHES